MLNNKQPPFLMSEINVESTDWAAIQEATDEFGRVVNELKEELGAEKLTTQQYAYCFSRMFQIWYGCKTPPEGPLRESVRIFETICMKHQIYALQRLWCQMTGVAESTIRDPNASSVFVEIGAQLKEITRATAQFKLSDTTLGQIALANHDKDVGLEYERKGTVERALIGQVKSARQLPMFF